MHGPSKSMTMFFPPMLRPRAEHGQRGEGHPQTDCTLQVSCSYLIVMILQRLCLLSECLNKCNFAMYSTTSNLYLHIPTYRSHLPAHPSSPVNSSPTYHIEIWTSVSSALCTATNNPQNGEISHAGMKSASLVLTHTYTPLTETNQSLCSKVFPAALSLLQGRVVEVARPAITLITSCIANNSGSQDNSQFVNFRQYA